MKHVVVDLEMNRIAKEHRSKNLCCSMEVIEIGAVVLDDKYQEIGCFKTLVKPQLNHVIGVYYEKLTGITTEMVESAPTFESALKMFFTWCHSLGEDLQFYQWSQTDLNQITRELEMKNIQVAQEDQIFLRNWTDFQKEYGSTLNLDNNISLENALMYAGLDFQGFAHDALFDARNTAALLEIVRDPQKCADALEHVIEALTPTQFGSSLAELFNLKGFVLAS